MKKVLHKMVIVVALLTLGGVCGLSYADLIEGYETDRNWGRYFEYPASVWYQCTEEPRHEGDYSMHFHYTVNGTGKACLTNRTYNPHLDLSSYDVISVWVYGDGLGNRFEMRFITYAYDAVYYSPITTVDWTGWQRLVWSKSGGDFRERSVNGKQADWSNINRIEYTFIPQEGLPADETSEGDYYFDQLEGFVPEPASLLLLIIGGLFYLQRNKK